MGIYLEDDQVVEGPIIENPFRARSNEPFARLPERIAFERDLKQEPITVVGSTVAETVNTFVNALARPRTFGVPSAWAGHWSTIHGLVAVHRPRRYVELGTHFGFSLIATSLAMRHTGIVGECIGIDTFEGDHQAGYYSSDAKHSVLELIADHDLTHTSIVQTTFSDARNLFHDSSVDMLLIDGLHTLESVRGDLRAWLSAVAPGGVVLLHDTCVYGDDFGVWRLWEEVANEFLSINFVHAFGLGVFVPRPVGGPLEDLLNEAKEHQAFGVSLVEAAKVTSVMSEELTWRAQKIQNLEAEIPSLKSDVLLLDASLKSESQQLARLRGRRAVKIALRLSMVFRPLFRLFRGR